MDQYFKDKGFIVSYITTAEDRTINRLTGRRLESGLCCIVFLRNDMMHEIFNSITGIYTIFPGYEDIVYEAISIHESNFSYRINSCIGELDRCNIRFIPHSVSYYHVPMGGKKHITTWNGINSIYTSIERVFFNPTYPFCLVVYDHQEYTGRVINLLSDHNLKAIHVYNGDINTKSMFQQLRDDIFITFDVKEAISYMRRYYDVISPVKSANPRGLAV